MTTESENLMVEVMNIIKELDARKDPSYEAALRRTVPSAQGRHATRLPEVRKVATEWLRQHRRIWTEDLFDICEALWATGWREERLVALELVQRNEDALAAVDWERLRRWSAEIDNWELADRLAEISGHLLRLQPRLLGRVEALASSDSPWQRRFALATLIVAGRDFAWQPALSRMAERLKADAHPQVRKAVVWARRELKKQGALLA